MRATAATALGVAFTAHPADSSDTKANAEAGHIQSMLQLAQSSATAGDGAADSAPAVQWYTKAAVLGDASAMFALHRLKAPVQPGAYDSWLLQAGEAGHVDAALELAEAPKRFWEVLNTTATNGWLHVAADNGSVEACHLLSFCYGIPEKQFKMLKRAANLGLNNTPLHVRVKLALAKAYKAGRGCTQDDEAADALLKEVYTNAAQDPAVQQYRTAQSYLEDAKYLKRAQALAMSDRFGAPAAAGASAAAHGTSAGGSAADTARAVSQLRAAAEQGYCESMLRLAMRLSVEAPEEGVQWLQRGAEAGHAACMVELSRRLRSGNGCDKDFTAAKAWCRRAGHLGDIEALRQLCSDSPIWRQRASEMGNTDTLLEKASHLLEELDVEIPEQPQHGSGNGGERQYCFPKQKVEEVRALLIKAVHGGGRGGATIGLQRLRELEARENNRLQAEALVKE